MTNIKKARFGRYRALLWPVHRHELRKLIPILGIFFLISFNYNVLRSLKDTLVITKSATAAVIPSIKIFVMFPAAILMTFLFTWISRRYSRETVFYAVMSVFLGYFTLFTFVLYPNQALLHPDGLAATAHASLPAGADGLISTFHYWTFSIFYAMSELWGNIVLFLLFWGFANEVSTVDEAKRFYALFGIGANVAGIAAGKISAAVCCTPYLPWLPFGSEAWEQSLIGLTMIVVVAGLLTMVLFRWMHQTILSDPTCYCADMVAKRKKPQGSLSLRESVSHLMQSRYLLGIGAIVLTYNLVINLVEVIWKEQVRELYTTPDAFNAYMAQITVYTGYVSTILALLVSGNAIRKCGWTFTALITPITLLVTSIGFFGFMFYEDVLGTYAGGLLGISSMAVVVFFGSLQNVLSRGAKYTVYDATKELAFVPLDDDVKSKGKTVIDGIGSRLGKSGGSVIHQVLLLFFGTIGASAPIVAVLLFGAIAIWIGSTVSLGRQFNQLVDSQEGENIAAAVIAPGEEIRAAEAG